MTYVTNYDQSSTGTNIEFNGFYGTDLSSLYFMENFEHLALKYRRASTFMYTANGQIGIDLSLKISGLKKNILDIVKEYVNSGADNSWSKEELVLELTIFLEGELESYNYDIEELNCEYGKNIEIAFISNIQLLSTQGYSQGDYAYVLVDIDQVNALGGTKHNNADHLQGMIDHLFWDSPIYATITVNDKEYYYHDAPDFSEYEWNRDNFIAYVSKESGASLEALEAVVRDQLEYQ